MTDPAMWTVHGILVTIGLWLVKHVREIRITLNGGKKD